MAKKVSMDDIAKKAGFSKNTVSLSLRGMPGINKDTRAYVLRLAQEMGYHYKDKNSEKMITSQHICIIVPTTSNDKQGFFAHIQLGIEQEARKHHYSTIFYSYREEDFFELPLCIRDGIVAGIITVGRISVRTMHIIKQTNLPFVMSDHYFDTYQEDCVMTDNVLGGDAATEYLIANGHRDIGFVGDVKASVSFRDRYTGFMQAMSRHGFQVNDRHCITHSGLDRTISETDTLGKFDVEQLNHLPTAFFCTNDAVAIVLYRTLVQMNIRIPEDVSVIGFDNTESSEMVNPPLSTMSVYKELMGKKAFLRLLSKIQEPGMIPERILIASFLEERKSVKSI